MAQVRSLALCGVDLFVGSCLFLQFEARRKLLPFTSRFVVANIVVTVNLDISPVNIVSEETSNIFIS
jgi:hypothetical protein